MDILILPLIFIICIVAALVLIRKWINDLLAFRKPSDELMEIIRILQSGSEKDRKILLETLQSNTQSLNQRLDNAARIISQVQKNIGELSEVGRNMKELNEFIKSPKLRGNIGEHVLKELLSQMLPKQTFHLQYSFKSGSIVDAAIETQSGIVPIDSKFPMENFRRMNSSLDDSDRKNSEKDFEKDVKKDIDDISKKYILTDEGTVDYALMYIPSEAVYYEIVNNPSLFDYAGSRRVLPVSPVTFYAYLKAILMSFEGQKIESKAKQIFQLLRAVQADYLKIVENVGIVGKHISNAGNQLSMLQSNLNSMGRKIRSTNMAESEEQKTINQG